MYKRLAPMLAMMVMLLLMPVPGHALGLGNLTVKSAMSEPLEAEIELISATPGDLKTLVVRLGTEEEFRRAGADRAFFLTKILFEVVPRQNNTAFIKLTTTAPFNEPFLNIVVEASWSHGSILREFTALVDPPSHLVQIAPAPARQPVMEERIAAATPAPAADPVTQSQASDRRAAAAKPVMANIGELYYGPVKANDTLYVIADQMRPDGVTINQMMVALVRENPDAFADGNINQLKVGYELSVGDPATITAISAADATAEVKRQHTDWQNRKTASLVYQPEVAADDQVTREDEASDQPAADEHRLTLISPAPPSAVSSSVDDEQLRQDLLSAIEELNASRQEIDDLRARLAQMEGQYESMVNQILLKEEELLTLRKQLAEASITPAEISAQSPVDMAMTGQEATTDRADAANDGNSASEAVAGAITTPVAATAPEGEQEQGIFDNPLVIFSGIGALVLIAGVGFIQRQRRIQNDSRGGFLSGDAAIDATTEVMHQIGESDIAGDTDTTEMISLNATQEHAAEIDPIAEAEVYLAYGRHQYAEDILKRVLGKEPRNNIARLKLLEVYFAMKNREAFERLAKELHDALGDVNSPLWVKAASMGSVLCADSDLFAGNPAESLQEEVTLGSDQDDQDPLEYASEAPDANLGAGEKTADQMFAEFAAAASNEPASDEDLDSDIEWEMDTLTAAEAAAAEKKDTRDDRSAESGTDLDLDVSFEEFELDGEDQDADSRAIAKLWQERQKKKKT